MFSLLTERQFNKPNLTSYCNYLSEKGDMLQLSCADRINQYKISYSLITMAVACCCCGELLPNRNAKCYPRGVTFKLAERYFQAEIWMGKQRLSVGTAISLGKPMEITQR